MSPARLRLILYTGQAVIAAAISGLTIPMFGDGTIAWAEFRFRWVLFFLGVGGSIFNTARAFYDQTPNKENQDKIIKS